VTALALPVRRVLSYDEMTDEGVALARGGLTIRDAAVAILDTCDPDEGSVEAMLRVALIASINNRINTWAGADAQHEREAAGGPGPRLTGLPGVPRHLRYQRALEHLNFEGADGIRRALIEFTQADCLAFGAMMTSRSRGCALKAKAMKVAAGYLRAEGKDRIGDLPEKCRDEIAKYLVRAEKAEDGKE